MFKYLFIGDTKIVLYSLLNTLSAVVFLIYNLARIQQKKRNLAYPGFVLSEKAKCGKKDRSRLVSNIFAVLEIIVMSAIVILCLSNLNIWFKNLMNTGMNYFGTLYPIPIILSVVSVLFGTNPLKQMDFIATGFPLTMIVTKLACFCSGCCNGIEWEYGLYNAGTEAYEFPIQLVEMVWAIGIFVYLCKYQKTAKVGTVFPMYTILYCATRFFSEFLSGAENTFGIFKTYHILCAIGVVYGVAQYMFAVKFGDRIIEYYDKRYDKRRIEK